MTRKQESDLAFRQGYYCAVANIIRTHDEDVVAEDVLRSYGKVDMSGIDHYDQEVLAPIAKEIKRKADLG